jgi:hypothetical protein
MCSIDRSCRIGAVAGVVFPHIHPPTHNTTEVRKNRLPFGIPWIPQGLSAALLMGTFVLGVGLGVTVDSAINTNPKASE